jgi:RNA polymerase sigma-70 factor (ECF subfamily)
MRSDDELAAGMRRGDGAAFAEFFDRHAGELLAYLASLCGERSTAEDLLQETMLRVVRRIDRYEERGMLRGWVFRIATNVAWSERRKRRIRAEETFDARVIEIADAREPAHYDAIETRQRMGVVEAGLRELSDDQRAVFLLRARHAMDVRAIAHILCVPEGTVKSRLHHAVRKLRDFARRTSEDDDERIRHDVR